MDNFIAPLRIQNAAENANSTSEPHFSCFDLDSICALEISQQFSVICCFQAVWKVAWRLLHAFPKQNF